MSDPTAADPPVVDIGIPVFRRATFVAAAVRSVVEQSFSRWRLTVSEDGGGSADVRAAVTPFLADSRVRYVAQSEQLGLSRHKSWLAAGTAPYLAVLDDDDLWFPGWLERRVSFLDAHPDCGMVFAAHVDVDPAGQQSPAQAHGLTPGVVSSEVFLRRMMAGNVIGTPSVLMRRSSYVAAGNRFDPDFAHINDYELWLRIGLQGPVGVLGIADSGYRVHPQQMSRRHDRAGDHLRLIGHLDRLLAAQAPALRLPAAIRRRQTAERWLSVALDAAIAGRSREAAGAIARAARLSPAVLGSRRGLAALVAAGFGTRVARRVATLRP